MFLLRNVTAGLFEGDSFRVEVVAKPGTSARVVSPSASKAYSMRDEGATVTTVIRVEEGASLAFGPHPLILQAGARVRQTTHCLVQPGGTLVMSDIVCFGRTAFGESLCFDRYASEIVLSISGRGVVAAERYELTPGLAAAAALGGYNVVASMIAVGVTPNLPQLQDELCNASAFAGISTLPGDSGYSLKLLGKSLADVTALCTRLAARLTMAARPAASTNDADPASACAG